MRNKTLRPSLRKFDKKKENKSLILSGLLGISLGGTRLVDVPGRDGFVYVRLRDNTSELIQAYNSEVSPIYELPVLLARQNNVYKIIGRDLDRYGDWGDSPYLPKHGYQHSFAPHLNAGADPTFIFPQNIIPALAYPSGTLGSQGVCIYPYTLRDVNGNWKYVGNTGTQNITMYAPSLATGAIMAIVYIDASTGNPGLLINSGTVFHESVTGTQDIVRYLPPVTNPNYIPDAAIRLVTGTTQIGWGNIYDVRQLYHHTTTGSGGGSGGGGGGFGVWDEGIPIGTGFILNVVGVNADISLSGSVARLFITGSTGGSSPPVTGSLVFQDEGQTLGSALILNAVGGNVDLSISGSTARLFVTGSTIPLILDDFTGQLNSTGTAFNLTSSPPSSLLTRLYYNGVRQKYETHYTISGSVLHTLFTPISGSVMFAEYNSSQGVGAVNIQDEGVSKGQATTFNFVGGGVDASVNGGVVQVNVTGTVPHYLKWYESGAVIAASGTTSEITLFSGTFNGGILGNNGLIVGDSLVHVNHAVVGNATLRLYYGSQSVSMVISEGSVTANKPGRFSFRLGEKGVSNSQYVDMQAHLVDGTVFFYRQANAVLSVDSTANQRLQLTVQWGASNNGLAYTQHHINVGYYP